MSRKQTSLSGGHDAKGQCFHRDKTLFFKQKVKLIVKFSRFPAEGIGMDNYSEALGKTVKNKLKRGLSAFDLITTLLAVVIVCAITAPILFKSSEAHDLSVANTEAMNLSENLTKQLINDAGKNNNNEARSPASASFSGSLKWEGLISKDPWGQSYSYKVIRDAYGLPTHVLVWSKGPNGIQDTPDNELRITENGFQMRLDDLGHLKEIY